MLTSYSTRKIFKLKQFALGIAGAFSIGYEYYNSIIDDFNKIQFYDTGLYNTLKRFIAYLDEKYPASLFPERKSNTFLGGGYVNGRPEIIGIDSLRVKLQYSGTIFSDSNVLKYAGLEIKKEGALYEKIENTIYNYANGENKKNTIGGPISIVLITPKNKLIWKKNNFSNKNYKSLNEFYEAVKNGKVKMHYLVPNGKEIFLKNARH